MKAPYLKQMITSLLVGSIISSVPMTAQSGMTPAAATKNATVTVQDINEPVNLLLDKTNPADLLNFTPDEIVKQQAEAQRKAHHGNIAVETLREFPMESALFFAALGLIVSKNLYTDYAKNPVALQQHIESLKDPVAHISFYTFMLANRAASKPMMAAFGNRKLMAHAVPYLGMSIGMAASHIASELLYPLEQCAKDLFENNGKPRTKAPQSCSEAYKDFVISEKIVDMVPGLISMLSSTAISSMIQSGIVRGVKSKTGTVVKLSAKQALKFIGVNLITSVLPGGLVIKGGQVIGKIVQISGFVALDHLINPYITIPYNNFVKGRGLLNITNSINQNIISYKRNQWNFVEDCSDGYENQELGISAEKICRPSLSEDLLVFQKKMTQWRQLNLSETMTSHDAWLKKVSHVSSGYSAAYQFYNHFTNELKVADQKDPENISKLDRAYPLNGVSPAIPQGYNEFPQQTFLAGPSQAERFQMLSIEKAKNSLLTINQGKLFSEEKAIVQNLINSFSSTDKTQIAKGLALIQREIESKNRTPMSGSFEFENAFKNLKNILGNPLPMIEAGRGYLAAYALHPTYKETLSDLDSISTNRRYQINNPTEILALQMICGPNPIAGDRLINFRWGFADDFMAPKIVSSTKVEKVCETMSPGVPNFWMYNETISTVKNDGSAKSYKGIIELLKGESSLRDNFSNWWSKNVDPHMIQAFQIYGEDYLEIVEKFLSSIKNKSFDKANGGPIANGALYSIKQEQRLYSLILGDMISDLMNAKDKKAQLKSISMKIDQGVALNDYLKRYNEGTPLMILLLHNTPMDYGTLTSFYSARSNTTDLKTTGSLLKWQREIDQLFESLAIYMESIQFKKEASVLRPGKVKNVFTTVYTEGDLKGIQEDIQNKIKELSGMIGLDSSSESVKLLELNDHQKDIASLCLLGLNNLSQELSQYLSIINAISFDDGTKDHKDTKRSKNCASSSTGSMTQMRSRCN